MGFTAESVEQYLKEMLPSRDEVLTDIEAVAAQDTDTDRGSRRRSAARAAGANDRCPPCI